MSDQPPRDPAANLTVGPAPAETHLAVSPHHLASRAAVEVMSNGGNAVDGAVAANAVLGVVLPDTCGPGGDLFALVHRPGEARPRALNASGRSGSGAEAAALRSQGHSEIPMRSPWTITIPGCVDGWEALLADAGSMTLADVLAPAIGLASNGFPVSAELAMSLNRLADVLGEQASAPPLYPEGRPPAPGTMLTRPRFAATLEAIAAGGRDAFYAGEVGRAISVITSGTITADDLAAGQAEWIEPIGIDVFGATGWTIPPNSQGYITLAAAWIFERITDSTDPRDPAFQHALIEAYRAVAWEREDLVADPETAPMKSGELLSPQRLTKVLDRIKPDAIAHWPETRRIPGGTAFLCTRDASGLGVSLIQSNYHGIGSGISAGATGVFLHDRGAGFNLIEGHPNQLQPGKRPLHTLSPTLWTRDGALAALLGTRGGEFQPQYLIQVAANRFRAGMPLETAQASARWAVEGWKAGEDPVVLVEPGHRPHVEDGLAARGHDVRPADPWQPGWGPVSVITAGPAGVEAAADPRVSTTAAIASIPG